MSHTPLLRESADDLQVLVDRAAAHLGIRSDFVEKDFWVTEVLRAATRTQTITDKSGQLHECKALFKGGTSLSRIYGIIERFSEDVDLLVIFPDDCSPGAKDRVLKSVVAGVQDHLGLPREKCESITSSKGVKRNVRYRYPRFSPSDATTEGVLLEMGSRGGDYPAHLKHLRSMVADYALDQLGESEEAWAEFEAFPVNVLAPERTLLEKLSALHDAGARFPEEKAAEALSKAGRHVYDVHQLLQTREVTAALTELGPTGVEQLCQDIDKHSADAGFSFSERPLDGYAHSPVFQTNTDCYPELKKAYNLASSLVYGNVPALEECLATVRGAKGIV